MPYQDWYTTATNAASNQVLPPALVPQTNNVVMPQAQPNRPINAQPAIEVQNTEQRQQPSTFAGSGLRTAGMFEKQNPFINPTQIDQRGDITKELRQRPKREMGGLSNERIMSQEDMMPYDYQTESTVGDPMESLYSSTYKL